MANKIGTESNYSILVVDQRDHIGGNCYSEIDPSTGIEYHKYGPHIFHTSFPEVWQYIRKFSEFSSYSHRVLANYKNELYPLPINLSLINKFFNVRLTPTEAEKFIEEKKVRIPSPSNFEELAISTIGTELYEAFFKEYTLKQWGRDPKLLPFQNFTRLPVRYSYNDRYFNDLWCGMPIEGYNKIFEKMLSLPNVDILMNTKFESVRESLKFKKKLIFSGSIDQYFNYCEGSLEYRTVELVNEIQNVEDYQGTSVINYPESKYAFTRVIEPKHFHTERTVAHRQTLIQKEYSREDDGSNPLYPIASEKDMEILHKYQNLVNKEKTVIFGGRLGMYRYLNMDQVIKLALETYENKIKSD